MKARYPVVGLMAILTLAALALATTAEPPTADTTAPQTTIDSGPSTTETSTSSSARFTFSSSMALHDAWTTNTDDALECIITRLKAEGYSFGLVYPSSTYNSQNDSYVEIR